MLKEFKEFAIKGNAVDLAVGVVIGAAFGGIVSSLVKDIIMPPIGLLTGGLDFSNMFLVLKPSGATFATLAEAAKAGAITWNYGNFITLIINFLIVAFAIFMVVRALNRMKKPEARRAGGGERLPVLRHFDSDQGHALPALHLGAVRGRPAPDLAVVFAKFPARRQGGAGNFRLRPTALPRYVGDFSPCLDS